MITTLKVTNLDVNSENNSTVKVYSRVYSIGNQVLHTRYLISHLSLTFSFCTQVIIALTCKLIGPNPEENAIKDGFLNTEQPKLLTPALVYEKSM